MMKFSYIIQRENKTPEFCFNENRFRSLIRRARNDKQYVEWAIVRKSDSVTLAQSKGFKS